MGVRRCDCGACPANRGGYRIHSGLSLRKTWESADVIVVRVLQIEAAIVSIPGVVDVTGTKINGAESNLQITDGTVPIKGVVTCL